MSGLENVLGALARRTAVQEEPGDYLQDGLLHCGRCGGAKQCRIEFDGNLFTAGCMCRCGEEAFLRARQERRAREQAACAMGLRVQGIQDRALRRCTFAGAEESRGIALSRTYAKRWPEMLEHNSGLLFWGGVGTGKTFAAACIANAVIDRGVPVLVTSFPRILNSGWDKTELTGQMKRFPLLVIDDLGAERSSDYALEIVQQVVDERYKDGLPLIVTTNLTLPELEQPRDLRFARIYDRVLEMCVPVRFDGPSRRRERAQEKLRFAREALQE